MGRDDSSTVTIDLDQNGRPPPSHAKSDHSGCEKYDSYPQLKKAREVALQNRRIALKSKLELRLKSLKEKMGDLNDLQIQTVGKMIYDLEDRHRTKLENHTENHTEILRKTREELKYIRHLLEKSQGVPTSSGSKHMPQASAVALSQVSSVSNIRRA